ncbi:hypothetical protein B0T24DRAFT_639296 [Lasiosphaeria ovina]|uniref:Uncharacterized protein n=1 Tax=Lasiosphaeria ovina TaxID=92902 RepID=A0AAE0N015_9PEZI|nr:hypothetical protein B0T24DRAFT_639296 [Lasiosphaeria ovina]
MKALSKEAVYFLLPGFSSVALLTCLQHCAAGFRHMFNYWKPCLASKGSRERHGISPFAFHIRIKEHVMCRRWEPFFGHCVMFCLAWSETRQLALLCQMWPSVC